MGLFCWPEPLSFETNHWSRTGPVSEWAGRDIAVTSHKDDDVSVSMSCRVLIPHAYN
jgi:hypothetical protein